MRIGGVYVGLGLGDIDPEVRLIKAYMRPRYGYARDLVDDNAFDQHMETAVAEMQRRLLNQGKLTAGQFTSGIVNYATKIAMGYLKPKPRTKPVIFTVEGHMSSMWLGPCAAVASTLEQEGVCKWQPIGYQNTTLPFNNQSGVAELTRLIGSPTLDDGTPFPAGTPWGMLIFSQGAIVGCKTYLQNLRPATGSLHWRLKDLRRVVAFGNPYRENNVIAPWVPDPPKPFTQGISDVRMTNTPLDIWREHSRHGDLYTENTTDEVGLNKTAVYKIVSENSWAGGPAGMLSRMVDLVQDPFDGMIDITRSVIGGGMFLLNMGPHGAYDLAPCVNWMRGVAS